MGSEMCIRDSFRINQSETEDSVVPVILSGDCSFQCVVGVHIVQELAELPVLGGVRVLHHGLVRLNHMAPGK